MGGKNIIMVMDDADVDLAVDGALWEAFGTAGQRCTASRASSPTEDVPEFVEKLAAGTNKMRVGDGLEAGVDMGPNVSAGQIKTVEKYVKIGSEEGATLRRRWRS